MHTYAEVPVGDVLHLPGDLVVVADDLVEVGLEVVVVAGLHGVDSDAGVVVLSTGLAASKEAGLERVGEGVVVREVEVLGHDHVGVGGEAGLDLRGVRV